MTFRKCFLKNASLCCACQICVKDVKVLVLLAEFYKRFTITFSGCFLYYI